LINCNRAALSNLQDSLKDKVVQKIELKDDMEELLKKYSQKLFEQKFTLKHTPWFATSDKNNLNGKNIIWNRDVIGHKEKRLRALLSEIFFDLKIDSLLFSKAAEPYQTIIEYLSSVSSDVIYLNNREVSAICPNDSETRFFLQDIPIVQNFDIPNIVGVLKYRKSVIIPGHGIITQSNISPKQAFVAYSSVCFACFVKFFVEFLEHKTNGAIIKEEEDVFKLAIDNYEFPKSSTLDLMQGPFNSDNSDNNVNLAMEQAGKQTVDNKLVESCFGNISYLIDDVIYISQTGSLLDELKGCIDKCSVDNSDNIPATVSSEFSTHQAILLNNQYLAVLHGHPKFAVIMSMFCSLRADCKNNQYCHIKCNEKRFINDVPIVPGEVGAGKYGLCHTVPSAIAEKGKVIVYGHGAFTAGQIDFNEAFKKLEG